MTNTKFTEMNLSQEMQNAIQDMNFEQASPIQAETIPEILKGKDVIGQAQTGTGKTAAFGIPTIENIDTDDKDLQLIVLCPTRELVVQVAQEFSKLLKYKKDIKVVPIYGGQQIDKQLKALKKGAQIVVGTPGRTMDHIKRGSIDMSTIRMVVLDEADEMLDMGFREDLEVILKDTSAERQTIMFSATMEKGILKLTKTYMNNPTVINVINEEKSELKIKQMYFEVLSKHKTELLCRLLSFHNIKLGVVFCNTKKMVDDLVETLKFRGYFADGLHGDMNQNTRDKVMMGFRKGTTQILVATDVAGRGIDVNNIDAVINYDLPRDDEDYTHRVGRTGRAGKEGKAFTFISKRQRNHIIRIERGNGVQIHQQDPPSIEDLEIARIQNYAQKVEEILNKGNLKTYKNQAKFLIGNNNEPLDVTAALLKLLMQKEEKTFDENVDFYEIVMEKKERISKGKPEKKIHTRKRTQNKNVKSGDGNKRRRKGNDEKREHEFSPKSKNKKYGNPKPKDRVRNFRKSKKS